ncbi:uncharacterized protein LOC130784933 [Actinidia eriantha]|uniref:uncharacterized protein LOC130784933 n=1 Tax=Actinidia eriantha TaxID=165200 RepID=UPI002586BF69|nr:uncharacterized protein LOC130784933 [Actinidia eriantha]
MADARIEHAFEADDDLSSWELISQSDDDSEIGYYIVEDDLYVLESSSSYLSNRSTVDRNDFVSEDSLKNVQMDEHCAYDDYEDEDEEEEEEGDLDDELVPKSVSDRFGRQRMRKLGKRAYPKMNKSKRLPYLYNRPGCVHGKHGLGLNHNIIV